MAISDTIPARFHFVCFLKHIFALGQSFYHFLKKLRMIQLGGFGCNSGCIRVSPPCWQTREWFFAYSLATSSVSSSKSALARSWTTPSTVGRAKVQSQLRHQAHCVIPLTDLPLSATISSPSAFIALPSACGVSSVESVMLTTLHLYVVTLCSYFSQVGLPYCQFGIKLSNMRPAPRFELGSHPYHGCVLPLELRKHTRARFEIRTRSSATTRLKVAKLPQPGHNQ